MKNDFLRKTNIELISHQYVHHFIALKKLFDLCVSFFKFLLGKLEKNKKNRFLMYRNVLRPVPGTAPK